LHNELVGGMKEKKGEERGKRGQAGQGEEKTRENLQNVLVPTNRRGEAAKREYILKALRSKKFISH